MEEMTDLIQSTLTDRYVLGLLDTEEAPAFERLLGLHAELRHEVQLARLLLQEMEGIIPPPELLRQQRLYPGKRLLPGTNRSADTTVDESATHIEKNADILLQHASPLFITEHKYLEIAFWSLVVLVIILLLATLGYYIALNWYS